MALPIIPPQLVSFMKCPRVSDVEHGVYCVGCVEFEEVSVGGAVSEETKPTPAPGIKREGNASQWSGAKQSRRTTSLLNLFMPNSQEDLGPRPIEQFGQPGYRQYNIGHAAASGLLKIALGAADNSFH
ncbi:hypothetical protein J6590_088735 [Homalodisca vitripennis]|nr:hypothetical protein J6590_088735 [Homalodisca vitripennis]